MYRYRVRRRFSRKRDWLGFIIGCLAIFLAGYLYFKDETVKPVNIKDKIIENVVGDSNSNVHY